MEKNWHISVRRAGALLNTADQAASAQAVWQPKYVSAAQALHGYIRQTGLYDENAEELRDGADDPINVLRLRTYDSGGNELTVVFDDVKINVTKSNEIRSTQVFKRSGTVKEFIQAKDYDVDISGVLKTSSPQGFPVGELGELDRLFNCFKAYDVSNVFLRYLNITKLVLERAEFRQQDVQFFNILPFSLTMKSDTNYDFLVEEI